MDEFDDAGLTKEMFEHIEGVSMVVNSPVKFACRYRSMLRLPGNPPTGSVGVIIGKVVSRTKSCRTASWTSRRPSPSRGAAITSTRS